MDRRTSPINVNQAELSPIIIYLANSCPYILSGELSPIYFIWRTLAHIFHLANTRPYILSGERSPINSPIAHIDELRIFICSNKIDILCINAISYHAISILCIAWFTLIVNIGDAHCRWSLMHKMFCAFSSSLLTDNGS
jgi:hypothetical protein